MVSSLNDEGEMLATEPLPIVEKEALQRDKNESCAQSSNYEKGKFNIESLPSLDSTYASGYHFDTPPAMSLESDIQPCGIDGSISSRTTTTISEAFSETTSSSEYKVLTEISSISSETSSRNIEVLKHVEQADSEDQLSSGTFSIDDSSPRYAELPTKLKNSIVEEDNQEEEPSKTKNEKFMSLDMRSTSITSNASEQEIPSTTPRDDLISPTAESVQFAFGDNTDKLVHDTVDIMTQSMYLPTNEQMTGETITDKVSDNFSILDSIMDKTEMTSSVITVSKEKVESKTLNKNSSEKTEITSQIFKSEFDSFNVTDIHSEVVSASKEETKTVKEEVKTEVEFGQPSLPPVEPEKSKLPETEEKIKAPAKKPDDQSPSTLVENEDPISGWGKPLGLPSPIRPNTPAKHSKKSEEQSADTNKVIVLLINSNTHNYVSYTYNINTKFYKYNYCGLYF